jgi:hypothetical protein
MLAHSPPHLLGIDYLDNYEFTSGDEEGIMLALQLAACLLYPPRDT